MYLDRSCLKREERIKAPRISNWLLYYAPEHHRHNNPPRILPLSIFLLQQTVAPSNLLDRQRFLYLFSIIGAIDFLIFCLLLSLPQSFLRLHHFSLSFFKHQLADNLRDSWGTLLVQIATPPSFKLDPRAPMTGPWRLLQGPTHTPRRTSSST